MEQPEGLLKIDKLITTFKEAEWCKIPYPNHPYGCPNYGREGCPGCPPSAIHIDSIIDRTEPVYFVYSEFDLEAHVEKMRIRHPRWSERQLRNVLYWQQTSRKQLRERVAEAIKWTNLHHLFYCPEAHGVNVYATALKNGLRLERIKDLKICRHVALLFRVRPTRPIRRKFNT